MSLFVIFSTLFFIGTSVITQIPTPTPTPISIINNQRHTPCPFINSLINSKKIECVGYFPEEKFNINESNNYTCGMIKSKELFDACISYGISSNVMFLASFVAKDTISLKKLLNPEIFPNHKGALAREDYKLNYTDKKRLNQLLTNSTFSYGGRISYNQLKQYQLYCWNLSDMSLVDKIPALVELDLMWGLFGAYKDSNKTIPLKLVYDFLSENKLPNNFQPNTNDQETLLSLTLSLLWNIF
jgi:hypothetical protein